ncbi:hypothetical protein [Dyadobacter sp. CY347]|uniref:hypothetical protein n=1 Tax=Dyadobacter sp. CY347 TaxID=2909336 RepID=UPI001F2CC70C|nr:hypothetical protein [Dyadobacter sp. CY347]MCF2490254.1 hypothetical protein [Dyadobacter sp. CY347]
MPENKYTLSDKDYVELWKHFNEDTEKIKDKLWTIASWLYGLMSGLLAFIVSYYTDKGEGRENTLVFVMLLVGFLLSIYTCLMVSEYGKHVRSGWKKTNRLSDKIAGLGEVIGRQSDSNTHRKGIWALLYGKDEEEGLPPFAQRLVWLACGYALVFLTLSLHVILKSYN